DPRRKYDCIIKLNGLDFKKGYIKLNSVNVKKNIPQSYNVQFFGELSSVKDILGNAKLKDLNQLSLYSYENTSDNVRMGFRGGFDVNITGGVREFSLLFVSQASTSGGTCTIILDSLTYSVDISSGLDEKETCEEIAYFIDTYVPGYAAEEHTGRFVFIVADEVGTRGNFTFVPCSGLAATATTVTEGADPTGEPEYLTTPSKNGDIVYPLISHTRGFEWSENDGFHIIQSDEEITASDAIESTDRLNNSDLKPSIKVERIFEA
ncbi:MAG: hypothetical protein GY823_10010, partial [Flavobacteriaceae bacterium]|nr:hypothetical protein [Flavobacteriaceae bacterium]